jgi:ribose 5-phosphate isomerase B
VSATSDEFTDATLQDMIAATRRRLREQLAHADQREGGGAPTRGMTPTAPAAAALPLAGRPAPAPDSLPPRPAETTRPVPGSERRVAIGADHGGYELKCRLVELLVELGYEPYDVGTYSQEPVDYPDLAVKVARSVARREAWRGIMIDGAGLGSAMAANKIPGVRAATCHNEATAVNSREHNDANVLVLGSGQVNRGLARRLVRIWLRTEFAGGRHARRVDKIKALDAPLAKDGKIAAR